MSTTQHLCPRCGTATYTAYGEQITADDPPYPAISRVYERMFICSDCGLDEAMRDMRGEPPLPPDEWKAIA